MELGKNKPATLLMVAVLAVSSLIAVKSLPSLAISKPSVPEILDISFSAHSYDVPPVTSIDPYTGKNITTQAGHRVENKTIDFTVKNQPFTPYTNAQAITSACTIKLVIRAIMRKVGALLASLSLLQAVISQY